MIQEARKQFKEKCRKEYLKEQVAGQVSGQNAWIARYAPLPLKNWFLNRVYHFNGYSTTVLSNLGRLRPEKEFAGFIKGYRCMLPVTEKEPVKIAVYSYEDELDLTLVTNLEDCRMLKQLEEVLEELGVCFKQENEAGTQF